MNDPDRPVTWPAGINGELPEHLWAPEEFMPADEHADPDPTGHLVSFAFIRQAVRRAKLLWCVTAVLGLVIGSGLYLRYPPAYHAQASVLMVDGPNQDPSVEILTDQSMAQSEPVAALVVKKLDLHQSVASFQDACTVTVVTDTVLTLNCGAPSSAAAVQRTAALATAFLQYRANYARIQQQQQTSELTQQYNAAAQRLQTIDAQISQLPSTQLTADQQTQLDHLQTKQGEQKQIMQYVTSTEASTKTATNAMVRGSVVLNAATAAAPSHLKGVGLYVAGGLLIGLAAGMAIAIVYALLSERLRRRDDIAYALGAPVRLSVGSLRGGRLPGLRGRETIRRRDTGLVVEYLRGTVPGGSRQIPGLAVVAVDDAETVARVMVELAVSSAKQGRQVVLADLSAGAHAARLLRAETPGLTVVSPDGVNIGVVVPDPYDVAPIGPLRADAASDRSARPDASLTAFCAGADLLLCLITPDPAFGADHVATWATDAVAVVTAGKSTAVRVHAVGEMIRISGTRLDSVVVLGADKGDESLGAASTEYQPA